MFKNTETLKNQATEEVIGVRSRIRGKLVLDKQSNPS
jgi:hypothetical protein